jgi:hypothetical protein
MDIEEEVQTLEDYVGALDELRKDNLGATLFLGGGRRTLDTSSLKAQA